MSDRKPIRSLLAAAALSTTLACFNAFAQDAQPAKPQLAPQITPEQRAAASAGLKYLASQQAADGSLIGLGNKPSAANTAIAGLAFLSAGSSPDAGEHKDSIRKAITWIIENREQSGLLSPGHAAMYGHGFALIFLSESYTQTKDEKLREQLKPAIEKAIALTESAQNNEGGWRYQPQPMDADVSVTSGQVAALQAAKAAGFDVDKRVIARAIKYIEKCQNGDGGFSYMVNAGASGPARTAAALSVMQRAAEKDPAKVNRAKDFLQQLKRDNTPEGHYFYRNYYTLQAQLAGDIDQQWYDTLRNDLLKRQQEESGSWPSEAGVQYGTAMAVVLLQMPEHPLGTLKAK